VKRKRWKDYKVLSKPGSRSEIKTVMKKLLRGISCIPFVFAFACNNGDSARVQTVKIEKKDSVYAIIGKVTGQDSGTIYLIHRQTGKTDSASLDHGYFKFSGKADTAELCRISLDDQAKTFFLENGKISMLVKKDSLRFALISGTASQDEYNYFQNETDKPLTDRMSAVEKAYDSANNKKDKKSTDSLDKVYENIDAEQKQLVADYSKSHPKSVVSAFLIFNNFSYNARLGQLDSLYQGLDTSVRITYFGKELQNIVEKTKLTAIGNPAPDFSSIDTDGKSVSLSSFKGKYVLLDFWASWCGPCRLENPNVVKAFHKFHNKGFDIFGVSLDETKPEWLQAIKKDGLDWTQVSDLKGWQNDAASLYGVKGIPMNFLIDKNGIIVAKGLRGDELDGRLAEILH
jgi:peroxiredoxin